MKYLSFLAVVAAMASSLTAHDVVTRARSPIHIPNPPGYVTFKGDFHIHTIFSDGTVWPSVRAEEAWREGLDVIAITDHIEYLPHKADVSTNYNRSYEIAKGTGSGLDVLVIHGSEITRQMPPGHLNAVFLTNSTSLAVTNWRDAVMAAHQQGAFIFWNHPGWDAQTTNGVVRWYAEHTELLGKGMLHGIEVVNGREYYPEAHRWAVEKKLTMMSNSDVHSPANLDYHVHNGDHRPITLVFAKERSLDAVKKALFERRTAVYSGERLIGDEQFLRPIFEKSIEIRKSKFELKGKGSMAVQIHNSSDLDFILEREHELAGINIPNKIILPAQKTVILSVQGKSATQKGRHKLGLSYKATNLLIGPDEPLPVRLELEITFVPTPEKKKK